MQCTAYISLLLFLRWIESVIGEELPSVSEIEDTLCNGVYLCKLGMKLYPTNPDWKKVREERGETTA